MPHNEKVLYKLTIAELFFVQKCINTDHNLGIKTSST